MANSRASRKGRARQPAKFNSVVIVYAICAFLALCGLADALYLTVLHVTGQSALCGASSDCSGVLASRYAHVGPVPVAGFGLVAYFVAFSCAVFAAFGSERARLWFAGAVAFMFLATLWFLSVQAFILHQYCRFCLLSAAITLLLTGFAVALPLRPSRNS